MGLNGIRRIEEYFPVKDENADHDPMLQRMYHGLDQEIFTVDITAASSHHQTFQRSKSHGCIDTFSVFYGCD